MAHQKRGVRVGFLCVRGGLALTFYYVMRVMSCDVGRNSLIVVRCARHVREVASANSLIVVAYIGGCRVRRCVV